MKKILFVMIAILSASAFSKDVVSTITCPIKEELNGKMEDITVEFVVQNLGTDKAELLIHPKTKDEYQPILITPDEVGERYSNMTNLNAQGGDLRVGKDKIRLFGDGDGYTFVDLVLYKDSGYTKGFVRVSGFGDKFYQKLNCTVK